MKNFILILGVLFSINLNATIRYVKQGGTGNGSSWAQASGDLQLIINQSVSGDEVRVGSGIYYPIRRADNTGVITYNNRNNAFVMKSGVKILGGYNATTGTRDISANPTYLDGNIGSSSTYDDNCYHVIVSAGAVGSASLDGFIVRNGNATDVLTSITVNGYTIKHDAGNGMSIVSSSPGVMNCTFTNNSVEHSSCRMGGGIYMLSSFSEITNCVFKENWARGGGGIGMESSVPTITGCSFIDNTSYHGGGTDNSSSSPVFNNCKFTGNKAYLYEGGGSGGAMYIFGSGSYPSLKNCIFSGNSAIYGGGIYNSSTNILSITNCVFTGNIATHQQFSGRGGAIYTNATTLNITNTTFVSNSSNGYGGALYITGNPSPSIQNCIIWGNTAPNNPNIYNDSPGTTAANCIIQGGFSGGTNIINSNPLFVNQNDPKGPDNIWGTADDGLNIISCSPAFNAGNNGYIPTGITTDITGAPRIQQTTVDLGAYECALPPFSSTITANHTTCGSNNGSATANPSGGQSPYTYLWNTGATTKTITGLAAGTYSVTITSTDGCTATSTTNINGSTGISGTITPTHTTCGLNNGSATANPSGGSGYTYSWSNGATTQTITGLAAGNYTVTITAGGCTATATTTINGSTGISSTITTTHTTCGLNNGSATANPSGGSGYTYVWNNGATTQTVANLAAGDYKVTVTASSGCSVVVATTVNNSTAVVASITSSDESCNNCQNGSATVLATGGDNYTYGWSNGATSQTIDHLAPGVYSVTVTATNGCTAQATATINAFGCPPIEIYPSYSDPSCSGSCNGQISVKPNGGQAPYKFSWSNGQTTAELSGLCAGFYSVTVTDALGCLVQELFPLIEPEYLVVFSTNTDVTTPGGSDGKISLEVWGGTQPYSYLWNTGATTSELSNLQAGIYTVTITDANGCSTTKENIISSPDCAIDIAIVNVTNASTPGAFDGSIVINVSGGTKPYTFQWYLNGVVISTEQDLYGIAPGSYTLVVTDAAGCIVGGGAYTVGYTSATTELDKNTIKLYPNPAFNFVNLYSITKAKVTIFTITGQQVLNFAAEKGENSLDISNLEPGVYFIAVDGHVIRFVKI